MEIFQKEQDVVLMNVADFDIEQILECGQCFRYHKLSQMEYFIIAYNRILRVKQLDQQVILYDTTLEEYQQVWHTYFDLNVNYSTIKRELLKSDNRLDHAIEEKYGVRILNQELFEMLITFIISQNKQIPHIKQIVERLTSSYGDYLGEVNGIHYHAFPTPEQLGRAGEADLRALKTGFRAPYIKDACEKILTGHIDLEQLKVLPTDDARALLMSIKGVGNKIADCVLLFGLGRVEAFPIDVWIKRIMEHLYSNEITSKKLEGIQRIARDKFGDFAGYAQQYLFYYGRDNKIGKGEK